MPRLPLVIALLAAAPAIAQVNAGSDKPNPVKPFAAATVATFDTPWKLAFLPDGRMLVTEKPGGVWLVSRDGTKTAIAGVPAVLAKGQGGMLGVFVSPAYAADKSIYLTYAEPGEGGSSLAMARATLVADGKGARLEG